MDYEDERDFAEEQANEALLHEDAELDEEAPTAVTLVGLNSDHGSVVLFDAITLDEESREVVIAVDHGPAQDLVAILECEDHDLTVHVESWQIVGAQ